MEYLMIRNWEKWQTYRSDRGQPPWIKLHRDLMRNVDWVDLTDAQRGQLVCIWMLAADRNGIIPNSVGVIRKLCFMDSDPDLKLFIDKGFIEHDANMTPSGRQGDANMTNQSREEESREERTCIKSADLKPTQDVLSTKAERFDRFWEAWPVKRNKKRARDVWMRKNFSDDDLEILIADVKDREAHDKQWQQGFIPHCSTYLNGHRWEDEYVH